MALLQSLLMPTTTTAIVPSPAELGAQIVDVLLPTLLTTPVLRLLSFRQRTLDPLDIEGLSALWACIYANDERSSPPIFGNGAAEPTLEEWAHFVDSYLARHEVGTSDPEGCPDHDPGQTGLRYYCLAYLLSATFKDCSIVIRMGDPSVSSGRSDESGNNQAHICQRLARPFAAAHAEAKIIDMDVKSIKRLAKWETLDREIVTAYARIKAPRTCVDSLARLRAVPC